MIDATFDAGAAGDFAVPELLDWQDLVISSTRRIAEMTPSGFDLIEMEGNVLFRAGPKATWALVVHPLWSSTAVAPRLALAESRVSADVWAVDQFSLERRPWRVRQTLLEL